MVVLCLLRPSFLMSAYGQPERRMYKISVDHNELFTIVVNQRANNSG